MAGLAARAGVSKGTVSLALRDHPRISETVRSRIKALAAAMGYRVAPAVSAWVAHRRRVQLTPQTERLVYLNGWLDSAEWARSPWMTGYRDGAKARAEALGYGFDELWLHAPGMSPVRMSKVLRTRGILGVLVGSLPAAQGELRLEWKEFAAVAQSHTLRQPELSRSLSDYAFSMQLALAELGRLGYRRIGYAFAPELEERTDRLHLGAFLEHQFRLRPAQRVGAFDWTRKSIPRLQRWLAREKPDALLSHDTGLVNVVRQLGYRVPRDLGVAALNLHPASPLETPADIRLAGVDQQIDRCGAVAVDLLVSQLHHHELGPPVQPIVALTRGIWVPGNTVRRRVD